MRGRYSHPPHLRSASWGANEEVWQPDVSQTWLQGEEMAFSHAPALAASKHGGMRRNQRQSGPRTCSE